MVLVDGKDVGTCPYTGEVDAGTHEVKVVEPDELLFVCDAMTGQDAVNSAKAFNEALELDGVIMTKLDGDARGGAVLSVKHVTSSATPPGA